MRILVALLAVVVLASSARAETPVEFAQQANQQVLEVLRDKGLDSAAKVKRLEQIAYARFDFTVMSRLVLARNWERLKPEQQQEFIEEFRKHLSVTYGRNVEGYTNEDIKVSGDREEPRGDWTVMTKILRSGGEPFLVDYRLRKIDGNWKVIDVVVEGISLVSNFRSQFQEIISQKGVDGMLKLLGEKNASGQTILPEKAAGEAGAKPAK